MWPTNKFLSGLNPAQKQAVQAVIGPVLVLAGAGTGKTRVITHRIAYMLERKVSPEKILAITFSRKAADEMRERVEKLLGNISEGLSIMTFHALGLQILRENPREARLKSGFRIYSEREQESAIERILKKRFGYVKPGAAKEVLTGMTIVRINGTIGYEPNGSFGETYREYRNQLNRDNAIDYDDMVHQAVTLLTNYPAIRNRYIKQWKYLLIDEYQDTDSKQYELTKLLLSPEKNLTVVGDDDQAIYGFRGARVGNIASFESDFPGAQVVKLETNYRSSRHILEVANKVIARSTERYFPKRLVSSVNGGIPAQWRVFSKDQDEVQFIAETIGNLVSVDGVARKDIVILLRVFNDAKNLALKLNEQGIKCSLKLEATGEEDLVTLMTLHKAKGLEYPVVFLPMLEEGTLPHHRSFRGGGANVEEERRLLYVGLTRAQKRLFLSTSLRRDDKERKPSRFLASRPRGRFLKKYSPLRNRVGRILGGLVSRL